MTNDLIFIDGQEGYMTLDFVLGWKLIADGVERKIGFSIESLSNFSKRWSYVYDEKGKNYSTFTRNDRLKILSLMSINANFIRDYGSAHGVYDGEIERVQQRIARLKKLKPGKYKDKLLNLSAKKIRTYMLCQRTKGNNISDTYEVCAVLQELIKKIPEKYWKFEDLVMKVPHIDVKLHINLLKINHLAIPYLEQQEELKRITLTINEKRVVSAMKELNKISEEGQSMDDYLTRWTQKLLKGDRK